MIFIYKYLSLSFFLSLSFSLFISLSLFLSLSFSLTLLLSSSPSPFPSSHMRCMEENLWMFVTQAGRTQRLKRVGFIVPFTFFIWPESQIGVWIVVSMGYVFNKLDYSHVLLLFIDVLMSIFGKSVGNLVNNIWFTVN